ncbi:MAG TPA: hypothetical protein VK459_16925, partial [Polyangiaceae bacterium]|nr:hypothetical protein [Polyangiaceae bacterium]
GVVGAAVGAGSLVAAVAAGREAKAMNQALLEDETRECTAIESGNPCFDVPGRIDDAMIFTAVGAAGIGLAVVGGGLITYEFLRADAQKNRPVGAALIAAPSGGILAFKGAW